MDRRITTALGVFLLALAPASALLAQTDPELRQEIEALKKGQQEMRKDLAEIKKLVQARPAAAPAPSGPNVAGKIFELGDNPVKGDPTAKLTLIEFLDYQ